MSISSVHNSTLPIQKKKSTALTINKLHMIHRKQPNRPKRHERSHRFIPQQRPHKKERSRIREQQSQQAHNDFVLRLRFFLVLDERRCPAAGEVRGGVDEERDEEEGHADEYGEGVSDEEEEGV